MKLITDITEVRVAAGISENVSDNEIQQMIEKAQMNVISTCLLKHVREDLSENDKNEIDGENTIFYLKNTPINEYADCYGIYYYNDNYYYCKVEIIDKYEGKIKVTRDGTNQIYSNAKIYITYYSEPKNYNEDLFAQAVIYLTAFFLESRLKGQEKITIADLEKNKMIVERGSNFMKLYDECIKKIKTSVRGT
ncbi:MAG: hypothetical protein H5T45_01495 [Thermoplasmatales archaeon]|nr:hypothetical protein [Thermoplasmatales archaeon]